MKKEKGTSKDPGLRSRAEERLRREKRQAAPMPPEADARRMVHELQVHQIELELQNDELKQARGELERQLEKYSDLYNFAPVGYFTLDRDGTIREANLTGAKLLGIERSRLVGRHLGSFLRSESRHVFDGCLREVCEGTAVESCEVALLAPGDRGRYVQMKGTPVESDGGAAGQCRVAMIDITERKKTEAVTRRLASFPELNPNPVLEVNTSGEVTFCNPATRAVLTRLGMDEGDYRAFVPEDLHAILAAWDRQTDVMLNREVPIGDRVFDEAIGLVPQFNVARIYGHDITERKQAEEAVEKSAGRVSAILESIGDAFFSLDENAVFTYFNAAAERLLGRDRQDVLGKPFEEAFPEAKGSLFHLNYIRAIREKIPMNFEAYFELPPYENWYDVRVYPRGKGISVFFQVVTERKRAESRSRKEMEYKDFLLKLNEKSPRLGDKELYDYVLEETVRLTDSAIGFFHLVTDDQENVVLTTWNRKALENCTAPYETHYPLGQAGNWVDCVRLKGPVIYNDFPHSPNQRGLPDGHVPVRRMLSVPVMEGDKVRVIFGLGNKDQEYDEFDMVQIQLVATTLHAIMKQRQAEEALGKARDELEVRVQERTAELSEAYDALRRETEERRQAEAQLRQAQKMEALGTLAGGIAHDFNNILAAMIGFSEMARDKTPEGLPARRHMERVFAAGIRGRDLVRQILTFSRQAEQEKLPLKLAHVVRETLKLLRASLPSTVGIHTNLRSNLGFVLADPIQMQQIVMNLCTNATHAMRRMGGRISIDLTLFSFSAAEDAPESTMNPGSYARLSVRDTGEGMSPEVLDHIFDPFFTTKAAGEGTGLGLSVVHGIVASHGGTIAVSSEPGRGSTFTVYLPKFLEDHARDSGDRDSPVPRGHERILFIDDEADLAAMGDEMLTDLGYRVTARTGAREALALFRLDPSRFDLVITDQTMPEMTGQELVSEILALRADTPVIMCTGYSPLVDADIAKTAGVRAFALKPLTKAEIAATIRQVLDE